MSSSIIHDYSDGCCYLCKLLNGDYAAKNCLEEHHIFGGPNRKHSEHFGLKVKLCIYHHRIGAHAVHDMGADEMELLHQIGQMGFERRYSHEDFVRIFGKNYLSSEQIERMERIRHEQS